MIKVTDGSVEMAGSGVQLASECGWAIISMAHAMQQCGMPLDEAKEQVQIIVTDALSVVGRDVEETRGNIKKRNQEHAEKGGFSFEDFMRMMEIEE